MLDIVILIACSLCGFAIGKYLERRARMLTSFYSDLTKYAELLALNVESKQTALPLFNERFAESCGESFGEYLLQNKLRVKLVPSQKKSLEEFFFNLGALGSRELANHIAYYKAIFSAQAKECSDKSAKAAIYPKLGILLGVSVGILLI